MEYKKLIVLVSILLPIILSIFIHLFLNKPDTVSHNLAPSKDLQELIRTQTQVSTNLGTHLLAKKYPNSNVVFSPISIHGVLSLLAAGAQGRTLDQLLGFLKTKSVNDLNSLYSQHASVILADGSPTGGPRLSYVNGVWVDKSISLKSSFKKVITDIYKAACNQVDFKNKAVEVADEVNLWAEKHTNCLIKKLLTPGNVDDHTKLIFANAVYFKGSWCQTFDRSMTKESNFHLLNGNKVQVPFMTSKERQFITRYDGFKIAGLPYLQGEDKRQFTMYFFLPDLKEGLQSLVERIGSIPEFLESHFPWEAVDVGQFLIPKFKISFGFEASDVLEEMALVSPFREGDCNLAEMFDYLDDRRYVERIYHKSLVEVNEEGTEAGAFSEMFYIDGIEDNTEVDFVADHPFLFVIREDMTGTVIFMGQVTNPFVG